MGLIKTFKKAIEKRKRNPYKDWDFAENLVRDPELFCEEYGKLTSTHKTYHRTVLIYNGKEAVFIMEDFTYEDDVVADDKFVFDLPSYFTCDDREWTSPLKMLSNIMYAFRDSFKRHHEKAPKVLGIVQTCSKILNYDKLCPVWEKCGIMVWHDTVCDSLTFARNYQPKALADNVERFLADEKAGLLSHSFEEELKRATPQGWKKDDTEDTPTPAETIGEVKEPYLIDCFYDAIRARQQDPSLGWDFAKEIAWWDDVFCDIYQDFTPYVERNQPIRVFYNGQDAVLILLDIMHDECVEAVGTIVPSANFETVFRWETGERVSPVQQLHQAMFAFKESFELHHEHPPVMIGIVATQCHISNYEEKAKEWEDLDILVWQDAPSENVLFDYPANGKEWESKIGRYFSDMENGLLTFSLYEKMDQPSEQTAPEQQEETAPKRDELDNPSYAKASDYLDMDDPELFEATTYTDAQGGVTTQRKVGTLPSVKIMPPLQDPTTVLESLVGLQDIKKHIEDLMAMASYNAMLRASDPHAHTHKLNHHAIFSGPVGTGKTTVGRIYASLLHSAGMLSKGHVVIASRSTFIGTVWGEEERNVKIILKMARGGLLFIDEAYTLVSAHKTDPGRLVLPLLLDMLADETYRDIAVVLAGYPQPMEALLQTNNGLESRFPNRFEFKPFTEEELMEITLRRMSKYQYTFAPEAEKAYRDVLHQAYMREDKSKFPNARYVANLLEQIYLRHARRCVKEDIQDYESLHTITETDVPAYTPPASTRIGFSR